MYSRLSFRLQSFAPFLPAFSGLKSWLASTVLLTQRMPVPTRHSARSFTPRRCQKLSACVWQRLVSFTNDVMANLGESPQAFVQNIKALLTGDKPFGEAPQSIIVEAKLISSWRKSRALMEETDSKRSKLMEDPHMIPEIPIHEYNSYRANLVTRHPDVLVVDYKEPHKKFLERLIRDLTVNEVVLPYRLGEIRLRSEDVVQKPGLSPTAEMLLKISQEEVPASVTAEDDATNRIHALFMALEYVNVVSYAKYKRDGDTHVGGSLDYLAELERRRRDTPGLQFLLLAD